MFVLYFLVRIVSRDGLCFLKNKPHADVLSTLSCLPFSFHGHPEGFGLPVAESLLECGVIGYSGLGGRELLSLGGRLVLPGKLL